MKEKNIKLIMEMIFIFILPLMFILPSIKITDTYVYDNNGNFASSDKSLVYTSINYDTTYVNYLNYNNLFNGNYSSGNLSCFNNYVNISITTDSQKTFYQLPDYYVSTNSSHQYLLVVYDPVIDNGSVSFRLYTTSTGGTANFRTLTYNSNYNVYSLICTGISDLRLMVDCRPDYSSYVIPNNISFYMELIDLNQFYYDSIPNDYLEYIDFSINTDYLLSNVRTYNSSDIISGDYYLKKSLFYDLALLISNVLLIDSNNTILHIVIDYSCGWLLMFIVWHLLYTFLDFIVHLVKIRKRE